MIKVRPYLRAMASGRVPGGDLRITLLATPVKDDNGGIELQNWPSSMRAYLAAGVAGAGSFKLKLRYGAAVDQVVTAYASGLSEATSVAEAYGEIDRVWKSAIAKPSENGENVDDPVWAILADGIKDSLTSKTTTGAIGDATPQAPDTDDGKHKESTESEIVNGSVSVTSVIPVKQADIAFYMEFERAATVARRMAGLALPQPDPESEIKDKPVDASQSDGKKLLKERLALEFEQLVKDTDSDRELAKKWWKGEKACFAANAESRNAAVAAATAGVSEGARLAAASHRYGYHPQKPRRTSDADDETSGLQMALAAYYAISTSPAWSRLFAFVIDLVVRKQDIPAAFSGKLKLSVEGEAFPDLPVVATWAMVDYYNFWPTSGIETCTEIADGFVRLNTVTEQGDPRHEILTLDVRRAVEAERFYGTATHERPQFFHSAGLTLVDRGRAQSMVRTLSRAKQACDACEANSEIFEIDAEDLMVGMRLDVGLVTPEKIHWRSLAERNVEYRLENDSNSKSTAKLVEILLGKTGSDDRRRVDQAILTTATRLVPVAKDGQIGSAREAIVEQALGTWDGSPMAVYCGVDVPISSGQESLSLDLATFQDLPNDGPLRLLPLRYGLTYTYAMRPVFAGGVSFVGEHDGKRHPTSPRRFLRHEPVAAPIILLPETIAVGDRSSPMDFERHDSVVLRSALTSKSGVAETRPEPLVNGRQYVPLAKRLTGNETVRVIVPPEASLDELLRQGQLDLPPQRKAVVGGGLQKVAFGFPLGLSADDKSAARFPVIKTTSRAGFDEIRLEQSRRLGWSSDPNESGAAQDRKEGQGTGIYASKDRVAHTHSPYRPDPVAETLFIRFRFAGTSRAAGDAVVIQDKALGTYPDRKPVVLRVRKSQKLQSGALLRTPPIIIKASTYDGLSVGAQGGQQVALVDITLSPGDDFEIDVFYLPATAKLASTFAVIETLGALALAHDNLTLPAPDDNETKIRSALQRLGAIKPIEAGAVSSRGLPVPSNLTQVADNVVKEIIARANVPEIAAFETMRLAHAVNRPATVPELPSAVGVTRPMSLQTSPDGGDKNSTSASGANRSWEEAKRLASQAGPSISLAKDYLLSGELRFHAATTGAIEIEAHVVSPRDPVFDNPDRKRPLRSRIAGTWPRRFGLDGGRVDASIYDVYGFENIDRYSGKVTLSSSRVRLLRIEFLSHPAALPEEILTSIDKDGMVSIDLSVVHRLARAGEVVVDEDGLPLLRAAQLHAFPDGRARELALRAVAFSRFSTDFLTAPFWDRPGAPSRVLLRQELQAQELRQIGNDCRTWLPATARPLKCEASAPVPLLSFERLSPFGNNATVSTLTRHARTRIYLKRSWYSSGEGERLGIVIWPPSIFSADAATEANKVKLAHRSEPIDVADMTDSDLGVAGSFVSRWGGDPTRRDRAIQKDTLIPSKAFLDAHLDVASRARNPHDPQIVADVSVPIRLPGSKGDGEESFVPLAATLLTYVPCFDTDAEEWYVDVDLALENVANPFVRFGLVRFQQNAISDDLRVSEPIVLWTQLLPDRTLRSRVTTSEDGGISLSLVVKGPASTAIQEFTIRPEVRKHLQKEEHIDDPFANLRTPAMRLWLVHETQGADAIRRTPVNWRLDYYKATPSGESGQSKWEFTDIKVGPKRLRELGPGAIYAYLEERDRRMPSSYAYKRRTSAQAGDEQKTLGQANIKPRDPTQSVLAAYHRTVNHKTVSEPVSEIDMFDEATFIDSGPSFSARIEVYRLDPATLESDTTVGGK